MKAYNKQNIIVCLCKCWLSLVIIPGVIRP